MKQDSTKKTVIYYTWVGKKTLDPDTREYGFKFGKREAMLPKNVLDIETFSKWFMQVNMAYELDYAMSVRQTAIKAMNKTTQAAIKNSKKSILDWTDDDIDAATDDPEERVKIVQYQEMTEGYAVFRDRCGDGTDYQLSDIDNIPDFVKVYARCIKTRPGYEFTCPTLMKAAVIEYVEKYLNADVSPAKVNAGKDLKNRLNDFCNESLATDNTTVNAAGEPVFKKMHVSFKDSMLKDVCTHLGIAAKIGKSAIVDSKVKSDTLARQAYMIALRDCFAVPADSNGSISKAEVREFFS